jgi:hypothetical protein
MVAQVTEIPQDDKAAVGIDALTAAETAMAERKAGQSITTLGNDAFPQVGLLGALGWSLMRRNDPKLTYEGYMSSHTVDQITTDLGLNDEEADEGKDDAAST